VRRVEVADIIIRALDTAKDLDIDVARAVAAKHEYNKHRPHMNGGKRALPVLLFSYGSNSTVQLAERLKRPVSGLGAFVEGRQRVFRGWSNKWGGGVASLQRAPSSVTYGYVTDVTDEDLDMLDRFEGVASGSYARRIFKVKVCEAHAVIPSSATAYISLSKKFAPPSAEYLEAVSRTVSAFWNRAEPKDFPIRLAASVSYNCGSARCPPYRSRTNSFGQGATMRTDGETKAKNDQAQAKTEIRRLHGLLELRDGSVGRLEKELDELKDAFRRKVSSLTEENEDLKERLKYEMRRASQALEVADNAAQAAGSVARIAHSVNMTVQALEAKLDLDNRRQRGGR
jgi:gas vesicle protein